MRGCVYFVLDETCGLVKIGCTRGSIQSKLSGIATYNPHPLRLMGFFEAVNMKREEAWVHRRFSSLRVHREWFRVSSVLEAFIVSMCPSASAVVAATSANSTLGS